jgi:alkyldihydroxyacetonephosphate synthase
MATPTPPIPFEPVPRDRRAHLATPTVSADAHLGALEATGAEIVTDALASMEASRYWWPLAMGWALRGEVASAASAVVRPHDAGQVAAVLRVCNANGLPVTAAAGRSGVCGASVPLHGGVVLDMTAMAGIATIDDSSLTLEVLPGTFGHELEADLRARGYTLGHWPQSMELSTVGGWLACRSAGQYSTRYGKIEQMVVALEVVLADGRIVRTGGFPAGATGPDLTQLFVGSEGTLGIITRAWLRLHPLAPAERRAAFAFASFEAGADACRRILRRGATPAVLRLYDEDESKRSHGTHGSADLLVLDEGEAGLIDATMAIVAEECERAGAAVADVGLVERWLHHRNDVSALAALTRKGFVVDTMEVAAPWSALPQLFTSVRAAMLAVPHARAATCHLSHSYGDGACLYFTFAATPPAEERDATYVALWDAGQRSALAHGANLSHHHGVGLNRARFMAEALGPAHEVQWSLKQALDPNDILNPGKLGFPSATGVTSWP